jgi:hypothetical protein
VTRRRTAPWAYALALVAVAVLSRVPQLTSPNLLLDGDESILGLMAKHVSDGTAFPIFFYGQDYGLAAIEAPAGAASFAIAGVGAVQLKVAILAIWTIGAVGYFLAGSTLVGIGWSFWLTLLLILSPAWAVSSIKAWSGYVTSFTATGLFLAVVLSGRERPRTPMWFVAGALTGIVFLAQPLWLPGLLPIAIFLLAGQRKPGFAVAWLAGAAGVAGAVRLLALGRSFEYWTPPAIGNPDLAGSAGEVLEQTYVSLTGSYNLAAAVAPGAATTALALLWSAIFVALVVGQIWRVAARRFLVWSHVLFAAVASTMTANWLVLGARDGRYLLPLAALLALWAGVEARSLAGRTAKRLAGASGVALLLGVVSMVEFRAFSFLPPVPSGGLSEEKRLDAAIAHMQMKGAGHAISLHPLLQWQVTFYSREAVVARWTYPVDRYPPYVSAVDRAVREGAPVAVIGYTGATRGLETLVTDPRSIVTVDGRYVVYVGADRAMLEKLGVRFRPDGE